MLINELQAAWQRTVLPMIAEENVGLAAILEQASPIEIIDNWLVVLKFPDPSYSFHAKLANDRKSRSLVQRKLYELTGDEFAVGIKR